MTPYNPYYTNYQSSNSYAGMSPMGISPMSAGGQLSPEGWGWLTKLIPVVIDGVLKNLSATPGGGMNPMSMSPMGQSSMYASNGGGLTPEGWGWLTKLIPVVIDGVLKNLSATPGGGMSQMSMSPMGQSPMYASSGGGLTPEGWGWLTKLIPVVIDGVLKNLSATPGGGMNPMSGGGPAISPYGGFMFQGPGISTPWGGFNAGGIGFQW
jgi:hypothetical protein